MKKHIGVLFAGFIFTMLCCIGVSAEHYDDYDYSDEYYDPNSYYSGCWYYDSYGYHDWEIGAYVVPTCEEGGYYNYYCTQCYESTTDYYPAYGHYWNWYVEYDATCTEEGLGYAECETCLQRMYEPIQPYGHTWTNVGWVLEPTCTTEGIARQQCTECWATQDLDRPRTDHSYGGWSVSVPSTDHSQGTRVSSCVWCGTQISENFYPDGTLFRGSNGNTVREMQQILADLHYLNDTVDGAFGGNTEAAVIAFQTAAHLTADGILWPQTQSALRQAASGDVEVPVEEEWEEETESAYLYPPVCTYEYGEDDTEMLFICRKHVDMNGEMYQALAAAADESAKIALMKEYVEVWKEELDLLYEDWVMLAQGDEVPLAISSKASFAASITTQIGLWEKQFADREDLLLNQEINAYMDQCSVVCHLAYESMSGRWTVTALRNPETGEETEPSEFGKSRFFELDAEGNCVNGTSEGDYPSRWSMYGSGIMTWLIQDDGTDMPDFYLELEDGRLLLDEGDGTIQILERESTAEA